MQMPLPQMKKIKSKKFNKSLKYLFEIKDKSCNICGNLSKVRDHNHITGKIRGALCNICNQNLGIYESIKHDSYYIIKARNKTKYINWINKYKDKIEEHLKSDTGFYYKWKFKARDLGLPY